MDARALCNKLNYIGMSKGLRSLAVVEKLADIREIATMTELEICELVLKHYIVVYVESEEIGLVKKSDAEQYYKLVNTISR